MRPGFEQVEHLTNIGPKIAKRLRQIGIRTRSDLKQAGSVATYLHLCASFSEKRLPVCYYLYSLEGALRDQHWDAIPDRVKQELREQVHNRGIS